MATTHPAPAMDGYSVVGHSTPPLISNSIGYGAPSSPPMSPRPPLKSEYTVVHHFVEPPAKKPHKGRRVPICHDTMNTKRASLSKCQGLYQVEKEHSLHYYEIRSSNRVSVWSPLPASQMR